MTASLYPHIPTITLYNFLVFNILKNENNVNDLIKIAQRRMSDFAAAIRHKENLQKALENTKNDIARAIIEGAALLLKDNLELLEKCGLKAEKITMIGGISNSKVCVDIVSKVLERPVMVSNGQGAGAVGACLLAGIGVGIYKSEKDAYSAIAK